MKRSISLFTNSNIGTKNFNTNNTEQLPEVPFSLLLRIRAVIKTDVINFIYQHKSLFGKYGSIKIKPKLVEKQNLSRNSSVSKKENATFQTPLNFGLKAFILTLKESPKHWYLLL